MPEITEPCKSCAVRCCNRFAVPLTYLDVARICERTGMRAQEFCELADAKNIETAPHSLVFIFEGEKMQERLLALKRKKNMYCCFSMHSKGCVVWGAHPMVCRAYPFVGDGKKGIKYAKNFVCPRKWEKGEYNAQEMAATVAKMEKEIELHNKLVRKWNAECAKNSGEKEFFEFMKKMGNKIKENGEELP